MNLLEYIIKIHSVVEVNDDCVDADVTVDCWGFIERKHVIMKKERWEQLVKVGYFLS